MTFVDKTVLKSNKKRQNRYPERASTLLSKILFTCQIAEYEYTKTPELISITSEYT